MNEEISAIVTAHMRPAQTLTTLTRLQECLPPPAEILVHVDGNQVGCAASIREAFPDIRVIVSEGNIGPGGARNKLMAAATHSIVASFDDDSYPIDADYFARVSALVALVPQASIVGARVYHVDERVEPDRQAAEWVADFCGGACVYRREHFSDIGGYVPIPTAYGMEEVDLALRLHAKGGRVAQTSWLRVFHDTDRARHADPEVTAASLVNLALLAYLRYPVSLWVIGVGQCLNRIQWLLRNGRRRGIVTGLARIPDQLLKHRQYRTRLSANAVRSYLALRRRVDPIADPPGLWGRAELSTR